jgi:hypothetical protein
MINDVEHFFHMLAGGAFFFKKATPMKELWNTF